MSQQSVMSQENKASSRSGLASGLILVGIGMALLLFQVINLTMFFPLVLGLIFLASGILSHRAGLLIPGGIISGVGLGALAAQSAWFYPTNSVETGGIVLLSFALGWFSIPLLSRLFTKETHTWALIPGAVMAIVGGLVLMGSAGLRILEIGGKFWPIVLVIIGLGILVNWWKERK